MSALLNKSTAPIYEKNCLMDIYLSGEMHFVCATLLKIFYLIDIQYDWLGEQAVRKHHATASTL